MAEAEGISFEELKERVDQEGAADATKKVKSAKVGAKKGIAAAKKKFAKAAKNDVGVLIKVKSDDGQVVDFEADEEEAVVAAPVKKKKPKAKTQLFKFLTVLDSSVWGCIIAAYFVTRYS